MGWFPGIIVTLGGMFTSIYMFTKMIGARELVQHSPSEVLKAFYSIGFMFSDLLLFPLMVGVVITIIGVFMIWKRSPVLPWTTALLSVLLFQWIGILLTFVGSVLAFLMWREVKTGSKRPLF